LEQAFVGVISGGLNAWLPFSTNVILPVGPTKFTFQREDPGYKLVMDGPGVAATLLLSEDMRVTSAVSRLPQPIRFTTEFRNGPDGFLLQSVKTADTTDAAASHEATFSYTYQAVEGFQLPALITVSPATGEVWHYAIRDCKVMRGVILKVSPPAS
jgi:hypothetical protein